MAYTLFKLYSFHWNWVASLHALDGDEISAFISFHHCLCCYALPSPSEEASSLTVVLLLFLTLAAWMRFGSCWLLGKRSGFGKTWCVYFTYFSYSSAIPHLILSYLCCRFFSVLCVMLHYCICTAVPFASANAVLF